MVGQLVESNGDRFFFLRPKLHHPNACTVGKLQPKIGPNFNFRWAAQTVTSRNRKFWGRRWFRVVQILQLIKYFFPVSKKWKLFPFAEREKDNFSKKVDRLTLACGNFFLVNSGALWDCGVGFLARFRSHSILFFCILYSFCLCFAQLCQTIAAFLLKVKMKTLFERCLSNYTLMEIFSVFFFV